MPGEWPYDLQALRGTEDWDDVIQWFLDRHSKISAEDIDFFVEALVGCVPGRAISVEVVNDPESAMLGLSFAVWGFEGRLAGWDSMEIRSMDRIWRSVPAFKRLMGDVGIDIGRGAYEDRRAPKE